MYSAMMSCVVAAPAFLSRGASSSCHGGRRGAIFGTGLLAADLAEGAGWPINIAVAQWVIRRPARRRAGVPTRPQQAGALS
jgi:hypothetical protein